MIHLLSKKHRSWQMNAVNENLDWDGTKGLLMGLVKAFLTLLRGPFEIVGTGYKWKRLVLSLAIIGSVGMPILFMKWAAPYQGAIPPQADVVKMTGTFSFLSQRYGKRQNQFVAFHATDGHIYYVMEDMDLDMLKNFEESNPDQELVVQGFFLQNGKGYFWPLSVVSVSGQVLLDPDRQLDILQRSRNPFGGKILWTCLLLLPLWFLSFRNARKLMRDQLP